MHRVDGLRWFNSAALVNAACSAEILDFAEVCPCYGRFGRPERRYLVKRNLVGVPGVG
jgi:hypothetical protein